MQSAALLAVALLVGQVTVQTQVTRVATPRDAAAYAAADLLQVLPADQPFQRYVWFPQPSAAKAGALVYTLNTISSSTVPYRPTVLHKGALIRLDLRGLAPRAEDLGRVRDVWEELALTNWYFGTIRQVQKVVTTETPQPDRTEVKAVWSGRQWVNQNVAVAQPAKVENTLQEVTTADFALHTGMQNMLLLHSLTGQSKAPIIQGDQFLITALTVLDGGLYYRFLGITASTDPKKTDLDVFLERTGTRLEDIQRLRSDQRIAMFRSGVTGKPRRIEFWNGSGVRPTVGAGLVTITSDIKDGNLNPRQHPIKSLASTQADARELIAMKPNGFLIFALFDGQGKLANEVPPDIAMDHTIEAPHTRRLEPGLSCIACHGPEDGFRKASNDVQKLLGAFKTESGWTRIQVLDDEASTEAVPETLERIAGWFSGDAELTAFRQARNDHHRAVYSVTGGLSSQALMGTLKDTRSTYRYGLVTPRVACRELGYEAPSETAAVNLFNQIVPFVPSNRFGIHTEDPVVAALRAYNPADPIDIRRFEWETVYSDVMLRVVTKQTADRASAGATSPATQERASPLPGKGY